MVSTPRPAFKKTVRETAEMLRRFIEAVESGDPVATTPPNVAVVRRLQVPRSSGRRPLVGSRNRPRRATNAPPGSPGEAHQPVGVRRHP